MSDFLDTKTSMVIYALEKSLAAYVKREDTGKESHLSEYFDSRSAIEIQKGRDAITNTQALIEASYINDIFSYALIVSKGTSDYDRLNELKSFCNTINLFFIRNQVSHPTRPFHDHYWYCAAAIASHPMIEALQFINVQENFYAALTGQLKSPPEEWFRQVSWEIDNNLPEKFDHDITSLIGRKKERKSLLAAINNPRINFISIVAPGGVGKTALVLDLLKEISLTPSSREKFDHICYVTLKKHHLTVNGITELENIDSISQIKQEIVKYFSPDDFDSKKQELTYPDVLTEESDKKVLLCIDNLETLLRDGPDEFMAFLYELPTNFKVIVTSRIMVDSSYPIPLKELQTEGAFQLAKSYSDKKGIMNLENIELTKIIDYTHNNPLAIRLTIDAVHSGMPVPESIEKSKKDIASFSFNNLIETLTEDAVLALECLFVTGNANREFLSHFLEFDQDGIAKTIKELTNTSLISRSTTTNGEDQFSLSESVKDLLIKGPRNMAARTKIIEKTKQQRQDILLLQKFQQDKDLHKFDYRFIPQDCPEALQLAINEANKILGYRNPHREKLIAIFERFNTLIQLYPSSPIFLRTFSRISAKLGDIPSALIHINNACLLESENPLNKLTLMYIEKDRGEFIEAQNAAQELIDRGYDNAQLSGDILSTTIMREYLGVHLYGREYNDIIEYTENWKTSSHLQEQAYFRTAALKRSIENTFRFNTQEAEKNISEIIEILSHMFSQGGLNDRLADEGIKALSLSCYLLKIDEYEPSNPRFIPELISFAENNLAEMTKYSISFNMKSKDVVEIVSTFMSIKIPSNPFRALKWKHFSTSENFNDYESKNWESNGYKITTIYSDFNIRKGYVYSKDTDGIEYMIHINSCLGEEKHRWEEYTRGKSVAIKATRSKKGYAAIESHLI
ncbi:NB-ARC domain-containing protein [Pantoea agglomerans]|uniref:NB-ARC domain-containing protein n=1 Tax=Enterobacter agglomerans TaxID=549 RepID=UPI00352643DA